MRSKAKAASSSAAGAGSILNWIASPGRQRVAAAPGEGEDADAAMAAALDLTAAPSKLDRAQVVKEQERALKWIAKKAATKTRNNARQSRIDNHFSQ